MAAETPATRPPPPSDTRTARGEWRQAWAAFRLSKASLVGALLVLLAICSAVFAPVLAPHDPLLQLREGVSESGTPLAPALHSAFPFGTDNLGRDVASRLIYGSRISLIVGVLANGLSVTLGVMVGGTAGFYGGAFATAAMRLVDIIMSFPMILLAVALVAVLKSSTAIVIIVIGAVSWVYVARVVYGEVLSIREQDYVLAARSIGAKPVRLILRHIRPQLVSVIVVYATLGISSSIRTEATLSFLGLGVPPPNPSWGNMIQEGQRYFRSAPWLIIMPGSAVLLTVLGFNLLGDGLRDALDPRRTRRR